MAEPVRAEAGVTLVEALVAMTILLMLSVGLLPLFTQSMTTNSKGGHFTVASNAARSALERYLQLDFNAPELTLPEDALELATTEFWDADLRFWVAEPPAGAIWSREITVTQFSTEDLLENGRLDDPLPGDAPADVVQLKRIQVTVRSLLGDSPVLGRPTRVTLEVVKAI